MLKQKVIAKIESLGIKEAAKLFGVSAGTVSNWQTGKTSPSIDALELALADDGEEIEFDDTKPDTVNVDPELFQWEGKNLMILQPVYRSINPDTHFTLFGNYAKYGPEKIGLIQEKRTVIHESRNIMANKFLTKTTAEAAIMVDDDMIIPCGNAALFNGRYKAGVSPEQAALNTFSRLMSHGMDKGIIGSLYFGRHEEGRAQCCLAFESDAENGKLRTGQYKGLVKTDWVGTGCLRITRAALMQMKDAIDAGKWPECAPVGNDGWYGFFTPLRVRQGEDVAFGRRAKELGIQSYVDATLVSLHVGDVPFGPRNTRG